MKKTAILLLLAVYTLATFGIGVNSHYCCGKLKSVTISLVEQKDSKCSKDVGPSCCNTKHRFLKVHDNHIASADVFYVSNPPVPGIPAFRENEIQIFSTRIERGGNTTHAPPLLSFHPLYILHCDYRI